jgi:hypothetical protein
MVENDKCACVEKKDNQVLAASDSFLPLNCLPLSHQVAGHFYEKGKAKLGSILYILSSFKNKEFNF